MACSPWFFALAFCVTVGGCAGDDPVIAPPETFRLAWGPVVVDPGVERTECVVVDVGNERAIDVHRIHNQLAAGSHHLVVYKDDAATGPSPGPFPCAPFASAVANTGGTAPMMITQKHDEELVLPDGVAYALRAHQLLRLEIHYLNATDAPLTIDASVELDTTTAVPISDHADFLFIGTPDIRIDPGAHATIDAFFTPPEMLADASYFAITGHTHQYGVDVRVAYAAPDAELVPVYAPAQFRWSDPETQIHAPPFEIPTGGGFQLTCEYLNTSDSLVEFGESANDEMCFFWAYYYPSVGSFVCAHTDELVEQGLDVCCPPVPGDAVAEVLCARLAEELTPE